VCASCYRCFFQCGEVSVGERSSCKTSQRAGKSKKLAVKPWCCSSCSFVIGFFVVKMIFPKDDLFLFFFFLVLVAVSRSCCLLLAAAMDRDRRQAFLWFGSFFCC